MLTRARSFADVYLTTPDDDRMHDPAGVPTFNESMYLNLVVPDGVAAWVRLGNRPNEGHAEVSVCVYLPDGSVAFHHGRPAVEGNARLDAGGLSFTVVEPGQRLRVAYTGSATHLARPLDLRTPREAFAANPVVDCRVNVDVEGTAPVYGGRPLPGSTDPVKGFADATTLQLVAVSGTVEVGGRSWPLDGARGLRDHSWGPRLWQAPDFYRWITVNAGADGFMGLLFAAGGGAPRETGFAVYAGEAAVLDAVAVDTDYRDGVPVSVTADLAWGPRRARLTGSVTTVVPLRHRRDGVTTSIMEGLTAWTLPDGRIGHGFIELLDREPAPVPA